MKKELLLKGYGLVVLSALLFGCMPVITRQIYAQGINRECVVLLRNLLALPVLMLLTSREKKTYRLPRQAIPAIIGIALMGCCVTPILLYGSYQHIATGTATVFHFIYPVVVVVIGWLFLGRRIKPTTLVAVLLCIIGICLFYNPGDPLDWKGCSLALASGITYAIYVVLLSVFRYKQITGFRLNLYISIVCTIVMLSVCLVGKQLTLPDTLTGWLLCILLAVIINVGAVAMFQKGTFLIGGEHAAILSTVEPLTGVIMGIVVFQETVTYLAVIGCICILGACILVAIGDTKSIVLLRKRKQ